MEELNIEDTDSVAGLSNFTEWVESFCKENNIPNFKVDDECEYILSISSETIAGLDADECFAYSLQIMNYAGALQRKLDLIRSQFNWCEEAINYLCAKQWDQQDKFMPAEIKKKNIIRDNSYAVVVEKCRLRLYAGILSLEETCKDLKKRANIFQDLGKGKSFR